MLGAVSGIRDLGKPQRHPPALHRDQPPRERRRLASCAARWRGSSARRRTPSPSSSGKRSTRRWSRPPTAARTSPTSSRASSSRTAERTPMLIDRRDRRDRAGLRLHQRLPRRRELDRDRRLDARADARARRCVWAAFFNFIAFVVFPLHVAHTIGKGIIDPKIIDDAVLVRRAGRRHRLEPHHLVVRAAVQLVARAGRRPDRRRASARAASPSSSVAASPRPRIFIVVSPVLGMVLGGGHDGAGRLAVPAQAAGTHRPLVPAAAAGVVGAVQPGPRRQRRAEDDGHHHGDADRQGPPRPERRRCRCG